MKRTDRLRTTVEANLRTVEPPRNTFHYPLREREIHAKVADYRRDCQHIMYMCRKAPKRGYSTSGLDELLKHINNCLETAKHTYATIKATMRREVVTMGKGSTDFEFITLEMTDDEITAYDKWAAKFQEDVTTVLTSVLIDDLKLSIALTDDVYYATLVGIRDGKYDKKGLSAHSEALYDAILLVIYKHVEILGGQWKSRKTKRGQRG